MIRFCDREVGCAEYSLLTRIGMLAYFLPDNKDGIICVYDDMHGMEYMGIVTYHSLQNSLGIDGAILRKHVVLCADLWLEARRYFAKREKISVEDELLPVLDQSGQLICFAYEDQEANREVRMLRELEETQGLLQFKNLYPQYKCVKINECNELAYLFARYLESQNIVVQVEGTMWQELVERREYPVPEYECLTIYAEGTWEKRVNWKENLLRSVSVEFECIDKIYEANIKDNLIKDAWGDCTELVERLRGEKEIIIYGTGRAEQNAYDFLVEKGIDVCCFVDTLRVEKKHRLFGKKIVSETEAWCTYKNAIFIDCETKNSAWGLGKVDDYDYIGYRRNSRFILLKDYVQIRSRNLIYALRNTKIALIGNAELCCRLNKYLQQNMIFTMGYLPVLQEDFSQDYMHEISVEDIEKNVVCLLIRPVYFTYKGFRWKEEDRQKSLKYMSENNVNNYTEYFSDIDSFIQIDSIEGDKYTKRQLMPKRVVLGSIDGCCGNEFFRGLLNDHPNILIIDSCALNTNLFWICNSLALDDSATIFLKIKEIIDDDSKAIFNSQMLKKGMEQLLALGNRFTSQELFVMFHIAYSYACRDSLEDIDIGNMMIYWEPHMVEREHLEKCADWLGTERIPCDIINIVRNVCMRNGSSVKLVKEQGLRGAYYKSLLNVPYDWEKENYVHGNRLVVKFEDLKLKPQETLKIICDYWDILWSDTLMATTLHGQEWAWNNKEREVKDFDLEPVYNTYEQFYSEFDRFRMTLIHSSYQREYGYPFVEILKFTRKELQEMFLKRFRFDNLGDTEVYRDDLNFRMTIQDRIKEKFQRTRMLELLYFDVQT